MFATALSILLVLSTATLLIAVDKARSIAAPRRVTVVLETKPTVRRQ